MAALVTGIAEAVGLQLLLQPSSSSVIFRTACLAAGVVYPAYETLKILDQRSNDHREQRRWLAYWAVFGSLEAVDHCASSIIKWIPFYWHIKLGFLLWLQLPSLQGAQRLVMRLRPILRRHEFEIDLTLCALRNSVIRPELRKAAMVVRASLSAVPVLGWLLRTPEEDAVILQQQNPGTRHRPGFGPPSDTVHPLSDRRPFARMQLEDRGADRGMGDWHLYGDSHNPAYDDPYRADHDGGAPSTFPTNRPSMQRRGLGRNDRGEPTNGNTRHNGSSSASEGARRTAARSKRRRNTTIQPLTGGRATERMPATIETYTYSEADC